MNAASEPPNRSSQGAVPRGDSHGGRTEALSAASESRQDISRLRNAKYHLWSQLSFLYRRLVIWWFGYDFFISYCHEAESYCQALYTRLSDHYVCFRDRAPEGILAGELLSDAISSGLRKSRMLIVIWSPAVATNEWPRAESRFFSAHSPHRRLILICPKTYSKDMVQILFDSAIPERQADLERWLKTAGTRVPSSFVPESHPRAIVEERIQDLRNAVPSDETLRQLYETHGGASVPRRARRILCSASAALLVLAMGFWMYYAAETARDIVAILQQSPFDSQKVREQDSVDANFALGVSIYEEPLQAAARQHQLSAADEWERICGLLDRYHYYRWWSSLGWGDQGIRLEIRGIPNIVEMPARRLPRGIVDLRLSAQKLNSDWLRLLSTATEARTVGISSPMLQDPGQLAKSLEQMKRLTDLRIDRCSGITTQWFRKLGDPTLSRLRILKLSLLPDLVVATSAEQQEFSSVLLKCRSLNELVLDQLHHCSFSEGFFKMLIQQHKILCETGFILVDVVSLPTGGSAILKEVVSGCRCRIQTPELDQI